MVVPDLTSSPVAVSLLQLVATSITASASAAVVVTDQRVRQVVFFALSHTCYAPLLLLLMLLLLLPFDAMEEGESACNHTERESQVHLL